MRRAFLLAILAMLAAPVPGESQTKARRTQWTVEAGPTWAGWIGFARRIGSSQFRAGASAGFAWELNNNSFSREVWNVLSVQPFVRYQPVDWFSGDLGLSVAVTSPTDDTNEARTFAGVYFAPMVGYSWVFFGPQIRLGYLGSETGSMSNFVVRVVLPFG